MLSALQAVRSLPLGMGRWLGDRVLLVWHVQVPAPPPPDIAEGDASWLPGQHHNISVLRFESPLFHLIITPKLERRDAGNFVKEYCINSVPYSYYQSLTEPDL